MTMNMFYIGSCRYMYNYDWDFFPARLHTTKEIIFFLENINNIEYITNHQALSPNLIFGDIYHPAVINDTRRFLARGINKNASKIILEICSRKIMYYNNIPINYYYYSQGNHQQYNLEKIILTDEEVDLDLEYIIKLCKSVFNENVQVHIIPHLNLKTKLNNEYIHERSRFVHLLESLCKKHNIEIHNVGKFIENNNHHECFLEDYMSDSTHYSKDYDKVKAFLVNEIM